MPRIEVSDAVLAQLRARRERADESDDAVLLRLLARAGGFPAGGSRGGRAREAGFVDATYGILFAEGFEIFRTYKGRPFAARVEGGRWRLDADGRAYESLNQLSQAVIDGNENAWMFWFFRDSGGRARRIAELRDPALVQRRPRRRRRATFAPAPVAAPPRPAAERQAPRPPPAPEALAPTPAGGRAPAPQSPAPPETTGGGMAWEPATGPRRR